MRYLKFKDLFTTLNLFCTFLAVVLLMLGLFELASYLIVFNLLILDLLDGFVARITKSSNEFGKHFDTIVDFLGSSVIISFFIFVAYRDYNFYLAIFLGFLPLFFGVLREIQSRLEDIKYEGYWIGLPRLMSGLFIIGYLNSNFLVGHRGYLIGIILILITSFLHVTHWPYLGDNKDKFKLSLKVKIYLMMAVAFQIFLSFIGMFWDGIAIFLICYIIHPPVIVEKNVWDDIKNQLRSLKLKNS